MLRSGLEHAEDVIVVGLAVILFGVRVRNLISLGRYVLGPEINVRDGCSRSARLYVMRCFGPDG